MKFLAFHGNELEYNGITRVQMEQVQPEEFNLKGMKSTKDWSTTYVLIQSFIKRLTLVVKQYFFMLVIEVVACNCALKSPLYSNFCIALAM